MVVVGSDVGGSEKFSHGMVRSRKPLFWCPFIIQLLPPTKHLAIQYGCIALNNIPLPPIESINDLILMNKQSRTNERISKYTAPPNPQGNCPRSMRSLAINYCIPSSLDCDPRFSCLLLTEW